MVWNETLKRNIPEGWEVKKVDELAEIQKNRLLQKKISNINIIVFQILINMNHILLKMEILFLVISSLLKVEIC